jgi:hypothetical protein
MRVKQSRVFLCWTFTLALAAGTTSCRSISQYVSPRVTGRVVDEQTGQPIKGVYVQRSSEAPRSTDPPKGGEQLMQPAAVSTGADGHFEMKSVRSLSLISRFEWFSVSLSFTHPKYERLTKRFQSGGTTNRSAEPLIETGDIVLKPSSR